MGVLQADNVPFAAKRNRPGYVDSAHAKAGSIIEIEIRRQRVPAEIIKGRFVTKK